MRTLTLLLALPLAVLLARPAHAQTAGEKGPLFALDILVAWCVVAYDALERNLTGLQRLLAELGKTEALATYQSPAD